MVKINVFISHSWKYSGHYEKLSEWIFKENWSVGGKSIEFANFSIPKSDPIHNAPNESELRALIYKRIAASDVFVCPTGMYANYSKWIDKELAGAERYRVPIIPINPWGQKAKSTVVQKRSQIDPVGWSKQSVVNALWRHGSGG